MANDRDLPRMRDIGDPRLPRKFRHPDDNKINDGERASRRQSRLFTEASDPNRVYQVISDVKSSRGCKGAPNEVGYSYAYVPPVTQAIAYNKATGLWEMASYSQAAVTTPSNLRRMEREVRHDTQQRHNRYSGGSI